MGISAVLDVVIGVVFLFTVFSLLVSGIQEVFARAMATRSKHLWAALDDLLDTRVEMDATERTVQAVAGLTGDRDKRPPAQAPRAKPTDPWIDKLYTHPLIEKLDVTEVLKKTRLSHIESTDFSRAMIDLLVPTGAETTVAEVQAALEKLGDEPFKEDFQAIARQVGGNLDQLRGDFGRWFDDRMAVLSRLYRKRTRWWLFFIALVVAVGFNVDAIAATQEFYRDDALRTAVAAEAEAVVAACAEEPEGEPRTACIEQSVDAAADKLDLPVLWVDESFGEALDISTLLGWIIAAAALAQGGPFWFDTLRRLSGMKKSVSG